MLFQYIKLFLSLNFISILAESKNLLDFLSRRGCPKYSAQSNIDLNNMSGVWYGLATNVGNSSISCPKAVISFVNNSRLRMNSTQLTDEIERQLYADFELDAKKPGELFLSFPIIDVSIFGNWSRVERAQSSIIYTDYTNIAVFFTCYELKSYILPRAIKIIDVVTRSRMFDSLTIFSKALAPLVGLGVNLDEIHFPYQGVDCPN